MDVLIVLVFVSIVLVAAALLLLFFSLHQRDFEHADRLSLLPLTDPNDAEPRIAEAAKKPGRNRNDSESSNP